MTPQRISLRKARLATPTDGTDHLDVMRRRYPNLKCDECGTPIDPNDSGGWPFCRDHCPDEPTPTDGTPAAAPGEERS